MEMYRWWTIASAARSWMLSCILSVLGASRRSCKEWHRLFPVLMMVQEKCQWSRYRSCIGFGCPKEIKVFSVFIGPYRKRVNYVNKDFFNGLKAPCFVKM